MKNLYKKFLLQKVFQDFFKITLTPSEESIAKEAIKDKYVGALLASLLWSFLGIPAVIFLDTTIIAIVLTPIAMVAGSAWFVTSLSTIKAKFARFGMDLTRHILESFVTSLYIMLYIGIYAVNSHFFVGLHKLPANYVQWLQYAAGILCAIVVYRIVYLIILGSLKYDMNDAMLTGQNEAAQQFFTKSLNFSYQVTDLIRKEENVRTTNYYISDAFSRIFNSVMDFMRNQKDHDYNEKIRQAEALNNKALLVLKDPNMDQDEIYRVFLELLEGFKGLLNPENKSARKLGYVEVEFECLRNKPQEDYRTKALRYATIFTLIYEIVTDEGEDLFL